MTLSETDLQTTVDCFVRPYYLTLLHGNLRSGSPDELGLATVKALATAASEITDEQLRTLLDRREWRGRLVASWFIGLTTRASFTEHIGRLLLASEVTYAGQGHCLALGLIGGPVAAEFLKAYLRKYLPPRGRIYDQSWAIGALAHLDGESPMEFMSDELWYDDAVTLDPYKGITSFFDLVFYLRNQHLLAPPTDKIGDAK